jgi:arginyl-tRNA synthetase
VALEGNSGPYLQYAHARACSILAKAEQSETASLQGTVLNESERTLVRKMGEYKGVVVKASNELMPHHICTYLYELAQEFNRFYEKNQVIGSGQEAARLSMVGYYVAILKDGLTLLGIHAPDRM